MMGMAQFKVVSHKMANFKQGETIDEGDLAGANIAALIEGGHIAEIGSKPSKKEQPKEQE
jgi:hypothetical protein